MLAFSVNPKSSLVAAPRKDVYAHSGKRKVPPWWKTALLRRGNWRALPRQPLQTSQSAQTLKRRLGYVSLKLACVQDALTKSGTITFAKAKLVVQITQLKLLCEINLDALAFRDSWLIKPNEDRPHLADNKSD